jgi:hypothetical protein
MRGEHLAVALTQSGIKHSVEQLRAIGQVSPSLLDAFIAGKHA